MGAIRGFELVGFVVDPAAEEFSVAFSRKEEVALQQKELEASWLGNFSGRYFLILVGSGLQLTLTSALIGDSRPGF